MTQTSAHSRFAPRCGRGHTVQLFTKAPPPQKKKAQQQHMWSTLQQQRLCRNNHCYDISTQNVLQKYDKMLEMLFPPTQKVWLSWERTVSKSGVGSSRTKMCANICDFLLALFFQSDFQLSAHLCKDWAEFLSPSLSVTGMFPMFSDDRELRTTRRPFFLWLGHTDFV